MNPLLTIEAAYALPQNTFIGLRLTPQGDPEKTVLVFAPPNSHLYGFRIGSEFHPNLGETIDYRPMLLLPQPQPGAEAAENLWAAVYPDRGPWSTIGEEARAEWRHFLEVALAQNAAKAPQTLLKLEEVDLEIGRTTSPKAGKPASPPPRFIDPATGQDQPDLSQRGVLVMPND